METKFTKAMDYFNTIINQVEKGSKEIGANVLQLHDVAYKYKTIFQFNTD